MAPSSSCLACIALLLSSFSFQVSAQLRDLDLIFPPPRRQHTQVTFDQNQVVDIRWESTWDLTSLDVYQGPNAAGEIKMQNLLRNISNETLTWPWSAHTLPNMTAADPFHLRLYNAENDICRRCHSNSSNFHIKAAAPSDSDSEIDSGSSSSDASLKLGLGLGLGLVIPLIILATALTVWLWLRKKRRNERGGESQSTGEPLVDWKKPPPPPFSSEDIVEEPKIPEVEAGGRDLSELPAEAAPVEVGAGAERGEIAELEGNTGVRRQNGRV